MAQIQRTVINNVRVFDGNGFTAPTSITIEGSLIVSNDESKQPDSTVDGAGGVLLPGLIDAHVHVLNEFHLKALLDHGVTTALDMAMYPAEKISELRALSRNDLLPDLKTAGVPLSQAGSMHSCVLPLPPESLSVKPEDAATWVEERIAESSDYIKIIADIPGPDQETMNAIVFEARSRGKKVVAHAASYRPFMMALEAKVDIITHLPLDKPVDSDIAEKMIANNIIAVPTLCMMKETTKSLPVSAVVPMLFKPKILKAIVKNHKNGVGKQTYDNAAASIAALHSAGVPILAGTDCHEEPNSVFDVKHGDSLHRELELLVEAGLSNVEVLRAATVLPAEQFGMSDRGSIEVGKRADLVLLTEDPMLDIKATRSINRVWVGGVEVPR